LRAAAQCWREKFRAARILYRAGFRWIRLVPPYRSAESLTQIPHWQIRRCCRFSPKYFATEKPMSTADADGSDVPIPPKNLEHLIRELRSSSAVACVIVGTSYVDYHLKSLLMAALKEDKLATNDPGDNESDSLLKTSLRNFVPRAHLAYCLGLISKGLYDNLRILARIRNKIAHRIEEYDLDHKDISSLCDQLTTSTLDVAFHDVQPIFDTTLHQGQTLTAREAFQDFIVTACMDLEWRVLGTRHAPPLAQEYDQWPQEAAAAD
jgi:hypothetical protein